MQRSLPTITRIHKINKTQKKQQQDGGHSDQKAVSLRNKLTLCPCGGHARLLVAKLRQCYCSLLFRHTKILKLVLISLQNSSFFVSFYLSGFVAGGTFITKKQIY